MSALPPMASMPPLSDMLQNGALQSGAASQNLQVGQAPIRIDAFHTVLNAAGSALSANPEAMGRALMSGLGGFSAREANVRVQVQAAIDPAASATDSDGVAAALDPGAPGQASVSNAELMAKTQAAQQHSMGVVMQTYSFALEATLVTNAATTFTSSVNTLIKTQ